MLGNCSIFAAIAYSGKHLWHHPALPCAGNKLIKVKHIRETSSFLIAIMPVMFIPAAVGLIDSWQDIGNAWFQYIVVTVVSTFVVMGASGWITQLVIRKGKEAKK